MTEKQKRGLACVSPERRREIAAMGGKAQAPEMRYFSKNPEAARKAGAAGGLNV